MDQPQVINITEDSMTDPVKGFIPAIRLTFKVGTHGPFTLKLPKDGYDATVAKQEMIKFAQQIGLTTS